MPHKAQSFKAASASNDLIRAAKRLRAEGHMQTADQIGGMIENHLSFAKGFAEDAAKRPCQNPKAREKRR